MYYDVLFVCFGFFVGKHDNVLPSVKRLPSVSKRQSRGPDEDSSCTLAS